MRLFVDIDDTLIKWDYERTPEYGLRYVYKPNESVIQFIKNWHEQNKCSDDKTIIVWSLGGEDYAREHGRKYLKGVPHFAMDKVPYFVTYDTDIFIDDAPPWAYKGLVIHPNEISNVAI